MISLNGAYGVSKNVDFYRWAYKILPSWGRAMWMKSQMQMFPVILQMEVLFTGQVERQIVNYFVSYLPFDRLDQQRVISPILQRQN